MDDHDPKPMTDGDITPPPAGTGFTPAAPLKDGGVAFSPEGDDDDAGSDEASGHGSPIETVKAGAQKLTGQAGEQVLSLVDQGKERATGVLDQLAQMLTDAAGQVDEKLGDQYGDYARQAAGQVTGVADQIRDKDVDDLLEDVRGLVRRAPGAAIGVSAAIGFVLARLVSAGLDQRDAA